MNTEWKTERNKGSAALCSAY